MAVNDAGTAGAGADRRPRRRRQDRHGAGHLEPGTRAGAWQRQATCATTAGSSSWCRGTTPSWPVSMFAEHSEHGYLAAPIASHIIETYYARKEGRPLPTMPAVPGTPGLPPTRAADRRSAAAVAGARRRAGAGPQLGRVRTPPLYPSRLAAAGGRADARGHRRRDDLQRHWRGQPRVPGRRFTPWCSGWCAMAACLAVDYRTLVDKAHWIYLGARACAAGGAASSAPCAAGRGAGSTWAPSTCSRRSSPRRALALVLAKLLGRVPAQPSCRTRICFMAAALTAGAAACSSPGSPTWARR